MSLALNPDEAIVEVRWGFVYGRERALLAGLSGFHVCLEGAKCERDKTCEKERAIVVSELPRRTIMGSWRVGEPSRATIDTSKPGPIPRALSRDDAKCHQESGEAPSPE